MFRKFIALILLLCMLPIPNAHAASKISLSGYSLKPTLQDIHSFGADRFPLNDSNTNSYLRYYEYVGDPDDVEMIAEKYVTYLKSLNKFMVTETVHATDDGWYVRGYGLKRTSDALSPFGSNKNGSKVGTFNLNKGSSSWELLDIQISVYFLVHTSGTGKAYLRTHSSIDFDYKDLGARAYDYSFSGGEFAKSSSSSSSSSSSKSSSSSSSSSSSKSSSSSSKSSSSSSKSSSGTRCSSCGGDGKVEKNCSSCGGDGEKNCISCNGKGRYDCGGCDNGSRRCGSCSGTGKNRDRRCSSCGGDGRKSCSSCSGTGYRRCTGCGGSGDRRCSSCSGSGKKTSSCSSCGGDGRR